MLAGPEHGLPFSLPGEAPLRTVRTQASPATFGETMSSSSRRHFVVQIIAVGATIAGLEARAQGTGPKLSESDPQAVALGYKDDTTKVDDKKYPKHAPDQKCSNCQLYQGKPTDALGGCALFPGKQVAGPGWCSAWNKKAG